MVYVSCSLVVALVIGCPLYVWRCVLKIAGDFTLTHLEDEKLYLI